MDESGKEFLKERSREARELISIYQQGKIETDFNKKEQFALDFYQKLQTLLIGPVQSVESVRSSLPKEMIVDVIYGKGDYLNGYLAISTGTIGERIEFKCKLLQEGLKSSDGNVQWMRYQKPTESEYSRCGRYWEKFIEHFGSEVVDLLA